MNKKSKLFLAFGIGALVGAAIAALYSTEEGKAFIKKAKNKVNDLSDDLKATVKQFETELTDFVRENKSDENTQA